MIGARFEGSHAKILLPLGKNVAVEQDLLGVLREPVRCHSWGTVQRPGRDLHSPRSVCRCPRLPRFREVGRRHQSWATIEQEPSGGFVVDATHTYSDPGTFYTTVFIIRLWRGFAVVHGAATVLQAAPAVTGISPASGPESGGTTVTITGTDLTGATDVQFGDTSAINFTVDGPTQITATAPGGTGTADITVTTPGGTSTTSDADQYGYIPAPGVTGIGPTFGPEAGGTTVTITGTGFSGATDVEFGSSAAAPSTWTARPRSRRLLRRARASGCNRHDAERHQRRQPGRPIHLRPRPCHHRD